MILVRIESLRKLNVEIFSFSKSSTLLNIFLYMVVIYKHSRYQCHFILRAKSNIFLSILEREFCMQAKTNSTFLIFEFSHYFSTFRLNLILI